jgi:CheY-like chemotaxis protein
VAIALSDTGSGMLPEVRERAFEPFFSTKPVGQGTGLGLSQVFGFVRQLGGHVTIESRVGHGTRITLYLPVAVKAAQPGPCEAVGAVHAPMATRARVLLVEDEPRVREVTAELLREAGFVVMAAADGVQAITLLRRGEPADVLFSDIVMPGGMNGVELAQKARRLRPGLPSRAILALASVSSTKIGVSPLRLIWSAIAPAASMALASGVPPPPGRPARLRLARASERVGGNSTSAVLPRKASTATLSRRT